MLFYMRLLLPRNWCHLQFLPTTLPESQSSRFPSVWTAVWVPSMPSAHCPWQKPLHITSPLSGLGSLSFCESRQLAPNDPYSTDRNTETQGRGQIMIWSMAELGLELRSFLYKSHPLSMFSLPYSVSVQPLLSLTPFLLISMGSSFPEDSQTATGVMCGLPENS